MVFLFSEEGWWGPLSSTEKVFWGIALIFSVLFLIQFVVSIIGSDFIPRAEEQASASGEPELGSGYAVLSVKSIIAFFTFFGWTGVLVLESGGDVKAAIGLAGLTGFAAMFIAGYIIHKFTRLSQKRNANLSKALYSTGQVYLSIPANKNGQGKVRLKIRGSLKEVDAMTNGDALPTGSEIKVVEILDDNLILVEQVGHFMKS